ncbi:MAG: MerR family transcriptional regulator [Anaerolineae bacterium]|nr:MerR family transcriptional regulator [Anaerolineae bacterium]
MSETWTIGQLARRAGLRASTLRYYEDQGLLIPARRTDAGYRLYDAQAEQTLRFIQRTQRLGFSLTDIGALLESTYNDTLRDETVVAIAESRLLDIERRLTELLILRREMSLFLLEFQENRPQHSQTPSLFDRLVDRVCDDDQHSLDPAQVLDWIIERTHCTLSLSNLKKVLSPLCYKHVHIWQDGDAYQILVVDSSEPVKRALEALARLEASCQVHLEPQIRQHDEGYLFTADGPNAFLFARLFLSLEEASLNENCA